VKGSAIRTEARPLALRNDAHAVFAADSPQRVAMFLRLQRLERRANRLELNDLRVVDLARKQRDTILMEQNNRHRNRDRHDDQQQQREPSEQASRQQRHVGGRSGASAAVSSSGTNTYPNPHTV
jgi:hypothetical protein